MKNTVYGTFNTLSKITGTLGKGIATLSMDDKYLQERSSAARKKPKHAGEGLVMGKIIIITNYNEYYLALIREYRSTRIRKGIL